MRCVVVQMRDQCLHLEVKVQKNSPNKHKVEETTEPTTGNYSIAAIVLPANKLLASLSHSHITAVLSHPIHDLLVHPLASQESLLHACDSPDDILIVLQQQVRGPEQSQNGDDRWTK